MLAVRMYVSDKRRSQITLELKEFLGDRESPQLAHRLHPARCCDAIATTLRGVKPR